MNLSLNTIFGMTAIVTVAAGLTASSSQASILDCVSNKGDGAPDVSFEANIDEAEATAPKFTAWQSVTIRSRKDVMTEGRSTADISYKPRGRNKDLNRFALPHLEYWNQDSTETATAGFVHYVLLPKKFPAASKAFSAILGATTDSYHDGIISYYKMTCSWKK